MYDQDEICQCLVVVRALILPALIEQLVKFVPPLKLEYCLKFQFNNLEVLGDDVSLGGPAELIYPFCCNASKLLTVLSGFEIVLSLFQSASTPMLRTLMTHALFNIILGARQSDIGARGEERAEHES